MIVATMQGTGAAQAYWEKVLDTQPGSLIQLLRLNETSGATAIDSSPESNDGAYTGVDLANTAGPDGVLVPFFDGVNDYCNIFSTGFRDDFLGTEFTCGIWIKPFNVGVWTDGASRCLFNLDAGAGKRYYLGKVANNVLQFQYRTSTTVDKNISISTTDWSYITITVSETANEVKAYKDGVEIGTTSAAGAWTFTLAVALYGAFVSTPIQPWHGYLGVPAMWNIALTEDEILELATV